MAEESDDMAAESGPEGDRAELGRMIDALMAEPPREWPAIIVVGDENVTAIYALPPEG